MTHIGSACQVRHLGRYTYVNNALTFDKRSNAYTEIYYMTQVRLLTLLIYNLYKGLHAVTHFILL